VSKRDGDAKTVCHCWLAQQCRNFARLGAIIRRVVVSSCRCGRKNRDKTTTTLRHNDEAPISLNRLLGGVNLCSDLTAQSE
jgi:hypothetical protein